MFYSIRVGESMGRRTTLAILMLFIIVGCGTINNTTTEDSNASTSSCCANISIFSVSTSGELAYKNNITMTILIYNNGYYDVNNLLIMFPDVYSPNLAFEKNNQTFSVPSRDYAAINVKLYINITDGDYEIPLFVEKYGVLQAYEVYHLLVDGMGDADPGLYNATVYNDILVNVTIQNFVNNVVNNNITIYEDMYNEIFNYFNTTIYNNINNTVYNEMYNEVYNEINNTFYAEVQNVIENNIDNVNNINNTLLNELYNFIYSEVNVTLTNQIILPDNQLGIPDYVIMMVSGILVGVGAFGIITGHPVVTKEERDPDELQQKQGIKKIITLLDSQPDINYRFKLGVSFAQAPLTFYISGFALFDNIKLIVGTSLESFNIIYGIIWAFAVGALIIGIDNRKSRIVSFALFDAIIFLSSTFAGIIFAIFGILLITFHYIAKSGVLRAKEDKINVYYKV